MRLCTHDPVTTKKDRILNLNHATSFDFRTFMGICGIGTLIIVHKSEAQLFLIECEIGSQIERYIH